MNHEALHTSMFWVGAMFAFTPIIVGGGVILVLRWIRRRERGELRSGQSSTDHPIGIGARPRG